MLPIAALRLALSSRACLPGPRTSRPVASGYTRSSSTASASWRGGTPRTRDGHDFGKRLPDRGGGHVAAGTLLPDRRRGHRQRRQRSRGVRPDLIHSGRHDAAAVLRAFDLIELDGQDLRWIEKRKAPWSGLWVRLSPASQSTSTTSATAISSLLSGSAQAILRIHRLAIHFGG